MAATATAVKLQARLSRLQEGAFVLQDKAWLQEAVGDLARRGKFLFDAVSAKSSNHATAAGAAVVGSSGLLLPQSRLTKAGGIIDNDSVESLVANLAARRDSGSSKLKLQSVRVHRAVKGQDGLGITYIETDPKTSLVRTMEEDEYGWETDPNGSWLGSFS
jgi:hypothetical protein